MRSVLHGSIDHVADPWHAAGKTGWRGLCAAYARYALCDFWPARAAGILCWAAADRGDVRCDPGAGADVFTTAGSGDGAHSCSECIVDRTRAGLFLFLGGEAHGVSEAENRLSVK
jgi:hypothetical protein